MLSYGDPENKKRDKKYKKYKLSDDSDEVKDEIKKRINLEPGNNINLIQLFNHLKGKNQNWLIIPYHFEKGTEEYKGTIRILIEPYSQKVRKLILIVNRNTISRWSFILTPVKDKISIKVLCNNSEDVKMGTKKIRNLKTKLQNIRSEIDDIIYMESENDGFTSESDINYYKKIDTIG